MASFRPLGRQRTHMLRVEPGEVNLGTLAALEQVSLDVVQGRISRADAVVAISRIKTAPPPYGPVLTTLAYGIVSGAATRFLGGGGPRSRHRRGTGTRGGYPRAAGEGTARVGRVFEPVAKLSTDGNREQLNSLLQGSEVQWWGTFDALVGGSTEFARAVRDAFWSNEDDEGFDDGDSERPCA